jgi:hypothetical protein
MCGMTSPAVCACSIEVGNEIDGPFVADVAAPFVDGVMKPFPAVLGEVIQRLPNFIVAKGSIASTAATATPDVAACAFSTDSKLAHHFHAGHATAAVSVMQPRRFFLPGASVICAVRCLHRWRQSSNSASWADEAPR